MKFIKKHSNLIFFTVWLLFLVVGAGGFHKYSVINGKGFTISDCFYFSLQSFFFNVQFLDGRIPVLVQFLRFFAPAVLISGIYLVFFKSVYDKITLCRIARLQGHVIVCGLSRKAELLITDLLKKNDAFNRGKGKDRYDIVLIEKNPDHERIYDFEEQGVKVIVGCATEIQTLIKANVIKAKSIVALAESDETNIEISKSIADCFQNYYSRRLLELERNMGSKLKCIIHLEDYFHLQAFKDYHDVRVPDNSNSNTAIDFHALNIYEKAAQNSLDKHADRFIDFIRTANDRPAELLIMGLSRGGENVLIQAAYIYHFFNLIKIKVFVVDIDVSEKLDRLYQFSPMLKTLMQIEGIEQTEFILNPDKYDLKNVKVCFVAKDTDGENVFYSKKLKQVCFNQVGHLQSPKVIVFLPKNTKILNLLDTIDSDSKSEIVAVEFVHLYEDTCTGNEILDDEEEIDNIARELHFIYKEAEAKDKGIDPPKRASIDALWSELNDGYKDSNRFSARHLHYKLRFVGARMVDKNDTDENNRLFSLSEVDQNTRTLLAQTEHRRWVSEKLLNGYTRCRTIQDEFVQNSLKLKLKLHKDLIEWEELDDKAKLKDYSTFNAAELVAERLGKHIVKIDIH